MTGFSFPLSYRVFRIIVGLIFGINIIISITESASARRIQETIVVPPFSTKSIIIYNTPVYKSGPLVWSRQFCNFVGAIQPLCYDEIAGVNVLYPIQSPRAIVFISKFETVWQPVRRSFNKLPTGVSLDDSSWGLAEIFHHNENAARSRFHLDGIVGWTDIGSQLPSSSIFGIVHKGPSGEIQADSSSSENNSDKIRWFKKLFEPCYTRSH